MDDKNSKIKQYRNYLGTALRTETTINDTAGFGVAKGLSHLPELKEIGFGAADIYYGEMEMRRHSTTPRPVNARCYGSTG